MGFIKIIFIGVLTMFCLSCNRNREIIPLFEKEENKRVKESQIGVHREITRREQADIQLIAKRYGWNLTQTSSGLFYEITNKNHSPKAQEGNIVQIAGTISLPTGEILFDSKKDSLKTFKINHSEDVVGLHELVQLLGEGESANAIIPSFLAYGISGDGNKIPGGASLICKIQLIKINK